METFYEQGELKGGGGEVTVGGRPPSRKSRSNQRQGKNVEGIDPGKPKMGMFQGGGGSVE